MIVDLVDINKYLVTQGKSQEIEHVVLIYPIHYSMIDDLVDINKDLVTQGKSQETEHVVLIYPIHYSMIDDLVDINKDLLERPSTQTFKNGSKLEVIYTAKVNPTPQKVFPATSPTPVSSAERVCKGDKGGGGGEGEGHLDQVYVHIDQHSGGNQGQPDITKISQRESERRVNGLPARELIPYRDGRVTARELIPYRDERVTRSRAHSVQSWTGYPLESSFRTEVDGLPARELIPYRGGRVTR
ncbi:hypothetical protein RRG08_018216 [Elysia crispata]|uniref:Uncharacterized protein n=1 Tax=Elysia crispata TaxID=231223 RepID=A0AAE0YJW8_9GAST|nr:hypothetical protein RRG08_018216 [Elysia crispata]